MNIVNKAIGIDIGGTKITVGAVDSSGTIIVHRTFATEPEQGFDRALDRIMESVNQVICEARWSRQDICGVGVGCPGPVDPQRGTIHNPYTLPGWEGCNMIAPLSKEFGTTIYLENDADAALLGEVFAGAARACTNVVMLTFGTGIGSGILVDGRIYRGHQGEHPELGHIPIESDGPECYCGRKGCFETIASGTALSKAGRAAGFSGSRHVFTAAAQGNPAAQQIVNRAVWAAATATWTILHTFLPQQIILGGGMIDEHYDFFETSIRKTIAAAALVPRQHLVVAKAKLGNDAGIVGAASLAIRPDSHAAARF